MRSQALLCQTTFLAGRGLKRCTVPAWPVTLGRLSLTVGCQHTASMVATSEASIIHVTAPDKEVASKIADKLVQEKLAACVQVVPGVISTYWWEGKIDSSTEHLLLIKTRQSLLQRVADAIKAVHPYDVPEVISTPVNGGSAAYLKWLQDSTEAA